MATIKPVLILGSGGHAKVVIEVLEMKKIDIIGIVDPNRKIGEDYLGVPVVANDIQVEEFNPSEINIVNGICKNYNDDKIEIRNILNTDYKIFLEQNECYNDDIVIDLPSVMLSPVVVYSTGISSPVSIFTKLVILRCVWANSTKSNFFPGCLSQYLEPLFILNLYLHKDTKDILLLQIIL